MSLATATARMAELSSLLGLRATTAPARVAGASASSSDFHGRLSAAASLAAAPTSTSFQPAATPAGPTPYAAEIDAAAARHGLDPALLRALIRAESNFDPNAGSHAGAQGLAQLMPGTARALGVTNPFDPAQSVEGGAKYLRRQLDAFGGDPRLALAAYNAGPGAVSRYGGVPPYPETQGYVTRVMQYAEQYRGAIAPAPAALAPAAPASGGSLSYPTL
jgi:soluble lytic murein transglycosylase-like protein